MMVPKQFERSADIQIAPIANWGRYYSKREVEVKVVNVMRNIIIDYWKELGNDFLLKFCISLKYLDEYYKVHAIYSVYYHDPEKRNMKIAIEQFDKNAHDKALKIGSNL